MARGKVIRAELLHPLRLDALRRKPPSAPIILAVDVIPALHESKIGVEEICAEVAGMQNLFLAAHGLGLDATRGTGEGTFAPQVQAFLGPLSGADLLDVIPLGYPEGEPRRRTRCLTVRSPPCWAGNGEGVQRVG